MKQVINYSSEGRISNVYSRIDETGKLSDEMLGGIAIFLQRAAPRMINLLKQDVDRNRELAAEYATRTPESDKYLNTPEDKIAYSFTDEQWKALSFVFEQMIEADFEMEFGHIVPKYIDGLTTLNDPITFEYKHERDSGDPIPQFNLDEDAACAAIPKAYGCDCYTDKCLFCTHKSDGETGYACPFWMQHQKEDADKVMKCDNNCDACPSICDGRVLELADAMGDMNP